MASRLPGTDCAQRHMASFIGLPVPQICLPVCLSVRRHSADAWTGCCASVRTQGRGSWAQSVHVKQPGRSRVCPPQTCPRSRQPSRLLQTRPQAELSVRRSLAVGRPTCTLCLDGLVDSPG